MEKLTKQTFSKIENKVAFIHMFLDRYKELTGKMCIDAEVQDPDYVHISYKTQVKMIGLLIRKELVELEKLLNEF